MTNDGDVQYHLPLSVGGQMLKGIMDTGSFELVVFSDGCRSCGAAGAYNELASPSFKSGGHSQTHAYGSGSCESVDGRDRVEMGSKVAYGQAMWLATKCEMPVLRFASFNAIVGVGPPGEPEFHARKLLGQVADIEEDARKKGKAVPSEIMRKKSDLQAQLADALTKKDLLENLECKAFSVCFGREAGSDAYFVWDDLDRRHETGVVNMPVVGDFTWSVRVHGMSLHFPGFKKTVGCEKGCGVIVDSGTSLLGLPSNVITAMAQSLRGVGGEGCTDLSRFPDLVISVEGGQNLHLPPSAYLGHVTGQVSSEVSKLMRANALGESGQSRQRCSLLLMDMGSQETDWGPLMILGMPFFREFYTTFNLNEGRGTRSISVAPADAKCDPDLAPKTRVFQAERSHAAVTPRVLDGSKIRGPQWLDKLDGRGL